MSILDYFKPIDLKQNKNISNSTQVLSKNTFSNNSYEKHIFNNINIYTDGSCINNGKKNAKAGIGIYISDDFIISEKLIGKPTNQRAELYAILKALLIIDIINYKNINIYTDSMYSINCVTKWVKGWLKNNWLDKRKKPVKNKEIIMNIYNILKNYSNIRLYHIEAHTNKTDIHSLGNNEADFLAKQSINEISNKQYL